MKACKKSVLSLACVGLALVLALPLAAQDPPIIEIPFDFIPDGALVQAAGGIALEGNVDVSQNLTAQGLIESTAGGIKFPDGSVQESAAFTDGASANAGLYSNRIVLMTPPQPFTEVCFKGGSVFADIHVSSESSAGGNCLPGDLGFLIERNQRGAAKWQNARLECLLGGMRLPEAFEWLYGCDNAGTLGLIDMVGDWEWVSNSVTTEIVNRVGIGVRVAGNSGCGHGTFSWVAQADNGSEIAAFHCVR